MCGLMGVVMVKGWLGCCVCEGMGVLVLEVVAVGGGVAVTELGVGV